MSAKRTLSELEGVCLGIVRKHGPCTAYKVRQELKESPSSHWQASAGSVYPLLTRLEGEGYLATKPDKEDGRGRTLLRVTRRGQALFKRWIEAGANLEFVSSVTDPVRSRMFFLDALSNAQQVEFIDNLIRQMGQYLEEIRERLRNESKDSYDYIGALGAIRITEARLEWLHDVRKILSTPVKPLSTIQAD